MSLTKFPNGVSSFGAPVGPGHNAGWWGKNIWFLDDDGGSDDNPGTMAEPKKTLQEGITAAGMHDTIFMKPREIDTDTHSSHGYYTGTNIIPTGRTGLAIIGTGRGGRGLGVGAQCMIEPDAASTDTTINVKSPAVTIENVGVKAVASGSGAIYASVSVAQAYGLTVSNCFFKDFLGADVATGTIHLVTTHWTTIQHCYFREGGVAIHHNSAVAAVRNIVIRDCDFVGAAATWGQDIRLGAVSNMVIDNCRFAHAQPTAGSRKFFIDMMGTSGTGMISNCNFAVAAGTIAGVMELKGTVLNSNCIADANAIMT
jgi:hypothetical protein